MVRKDKAKRRPRSPATRERRRRAAASDPGHKWGRRINGAYIVILQPTVKPEDLLSTVLKGFTPQFSYGTIFIGFAVEGVSEEKATELQLDPRVLKVVENRRIVGLSKELLIDTLQTGYTVVNRDTGELYDVRELDGTAPYRYSILPYSADVPAKARNILGINDKKTTMPDKAAKVMGHGGREAAAGRRSKRASKAASISLGVQPMRKAASTGAVKLPSERLQTWYEEEPRLAPPGASDAGARDATGRAPADSDEDEEAWSYHSGESPKAVVSAPQTPQRSSAWSSLSSPRTPFSDGTRAMWRRMRAHGRGKSQRRPSPPRPEPTMSPVSLLVNAIGNARVRRTSKSAPSGRNYGLTALFPSPPGRAPAEAG